MFWFLEGEAAGENEWFFSLVDALGQMDGMCKCINVIRGAHNLMHKQRNLNDSTQPLWLGEEALAKKMVFRLERYESVNNLVFFSYSVFASFGKKRTLRILAVRQLAVFRAERKKYVSFVSDFNARCSCTELRQSQFPLNCSMFVYSSCRAEMKLRLH